MTVLEEIIEDAFAIIESNTARKAETKSKRDAWQLSKNSYDYEWDDGYRRKMALVRQRKNDTLRKNGVPKDYIPTPDKYDVNGFNNFYKTSYENWYDGSPFNGDTEFLSYSAKKLRQMLEPLEKYTSQSKQARNNILDLKQKLKHMLKDFPRKINSEEGKTTMKLTKKDMEPFFKEAKKEIDKCLYKLKENGLIKEELKFKYFNY